MFVWALEDCAVRACMIVSRACLLLFGLCVPHRVPVGAVRFSSGFSATHDHRDECRCKPRRIDVCVSQQACQQKVHEQPKYRDRIRPPPTRINNPRRTHEVHNDTRVILTFGEYPDSVRTLE